jgi:arsenate reductase
MAEGLLRHLAGDRYDVSSAGTHPQGVHPKSIQVMGELGIELISQSSDHVDEYVDQRFDYVVTVCDRAKEQCPVFPDASALHWAFDDPAAAAANKQTIEFRRVRDAIRSRIQLFIAGEPV